MKAMLHAAFAAALAHAALAEVKVEIGLVRDNRAIGRVSSSGLEVELKLDGPELAEARGIRTTLKTVADDSGYVLVTSASHDSGFGELKKGKRTSFGGSSNTFKTEEWFHVMLEFANPPRGAKAIKTLEGRIELLIPVKETETIITASVAKDAGKPLENAVLKAADVQITLLKPGQEKKRQDGPFVRDETFRENDLGYELTDLKSKVTSVEFFDSAGKKLQSSGYASNGMKFKNPVVWRITFREKPPVDAVAKIKLVTEMSVVTVPFALKDIVLP